MGDGIMLWPQSRLWRCVASVSQWDGFGAGVVLLGCIVDVELAVLCCVAFR
jgi:hypothetical protein